MQDSEKAFTFNRLYPQGNRDDASNMRQMERNKQMKKSFFFKFKKCNWS